MSKVFLRAKFAQKVVFQLGLAIKFVLCAILVNIKMRSRKDPAKNALQVMPSIVKGLKTVIYASKELLQQGLEINSVVIVPKVIFPIFIIVYILII